jgi:poly(hydroxyalkanoate) granule-associated protein
VKTLDKPGKLAAHRALAHKKYLEGLVAKLKKTVRAKSSAAKSNSGDLQATAEHLSRSLVESAQQIWMAGVGAFTRAQGEGSKFFEALVSEGMNIEKTTRKLATGKVDAVRDAMEDRVGVVRGRASDTWDRLEKVFEDRVQRALNRLGIPGREELAELIARVDELTKQLKKSGGAAAAKSVKARKRAVAAKPKAARKAVKKASKAPAKASKTARKSSRKTLPKAAKPVAPNA